MKNFLIIPLMFFAFIMNAQTKITPTAIAVLSGKPEGVDLLFDNNTQTGWFAGWDANQYPAKVQVDFGIPVSLSKIRVLDNVGKPTVSFFENNNKFLEIELSLFGAWHEREVSTVKSRYFTFTISDIQGDIPIREIEFFGGTTTTPPITNVPNSLKSLSGDAKKLGMNGFHWIPSDIIPFALLREYQMFQWTWMVNGFMPQPSYQGNANYDDHFKKMKDLGIEVIPCINEIPEFMRSASDPQAKFLRVTDVGKIGDNPEDYKEVTKYAWQYVARYGSKVHPQTDLIVNQTPRWNGDVINQKKSGLDLLKYVEFENEPDRPWNDIEHKYTPEQFAAFMSAIWDGHEGRLGKIGVKNADPNMKVVLSGLAEINLVYLDRMKNWFIVNRTDKRFCSDVINVHHYNNSKNPKWPAHSIDLTGEGISPEADNLEYRLKDLVQFVSQNMIEGTEVWYSEFGYDTKAPAIKWLSQYPKLYGNHTAEELQSIWLQRAFLIGLSSGVDKMFLFNGIDNNAAHTGSLFLSSGIMGAEYPQIGSPYVKKQSYGDLQKLVKNLDKYTFKSDLSINGVTILEFRNKLTKKYFYWSPTSNDTTKEFKIGTKSLVATETPQIYVPKVIRISLNVGNKISSDEN